MDVRAQEGDNMKTSFARYIGCCSILLSVTVGCEESKPSITWRRDVEPIQKRIPVLSSCTNMLWHGEIITRNSFMSPAGPSAYRVCCFVPRASRYIASLPSGGAASDAAENNLPLEPVEKAMLKSEYGIDLAVDTWIINANISHELLSSPCWGQCVFFVSKDVLCIILYGE